MWDIPRTTVAAMVVALLAVVVAPSVAEAQTCRRDRDCQAGDVCRDGGCVLVPRCAGDDCICSSDAACSAGRLCDVEAGRCFDAQCRGDRDCPVAELCVRGRCLPDLGADRDHDGIPDAADNCPHEVNPGQADHDRDAQGDACDLDWDEDSVANAQDNCPWHPNVGQWDRNRDGVGDACEPDIDYDGVPDDIDNCTITRLNSYNPDQLDSDGDGVGDICELDRVRPPKRLRIESLPEGVLPPLPSIERR